MREQLPVQVQHKPGRMELVRKLGQRMEQKPVQILVPQLRQGSQSRCRDCSLVASA